MPFFLNLYFQAPKHPLAHVSMQIRTKPRTPSLMALPDEIILDDFLLHTITDERKIKILFELLEKRNEQRKSTIVCSQRDPDNWKAMILNDEVSANSIMKRATKHYTIKINTR